MAERVFNIIQLGEQAGTFAAPGASVAATVLFPGIVATMPELDRASQFAEEDRGRNVRNPAGRGTHGIRGASFGLSGEVRFATFPYLLEMHNAGDVVPTGAGPFTYVYPFEGGAPTLSPYTVEMGTETTQDQWEVAGCLIDELTVGFDELAAPGYSPWTFDASFLGIDRDSAALTPALSPLALDIETMAGQFTLIKEGTTATAFASLVELAAHLISFTITTRRNLVLRPYGGTSDVATGYGFSERSVGELTAKVKVSASAKSSFLDIYDVAGSALTERRWRITPDGNGNNVAHLDMRVGFLSVNPSDRDGEGVYEISGEIVDDTTLVAPATWTVINDVSALS